MPRAAGARRDGAVGSHTFDKYDTMGAYHWVECDPRSRRYNPALAARYHVLAKQLGSAGSVLDVGCGDGYLTGVASRTGISVIGVDTDSTGVRLAAEALRGFPNCSVARASCYALPFDDGVFDTVLLADVIEHLDDPGCCLCEIARVLTGGGTLLLTTPKWRPDRRWDPRHVKEYTPGDLRGQLDVWFADVTLSFFWPLGWCNLLNTRLGFHVVPIIARYLFNPFLRQATRQCDDYGQVLAVCRHPRLQLRSTDIPLGS